MDDNKLLKLREVGYTIRRTCGSCVHGSFPNNQWGSCSVNTYDHLKHDNPDEGREMSVHQFGYCEKYTPKVWIHGAWMEFGE